MVYTRAGKTYGKYDEKTKILIKDHLTNKHLLWSMGGVPALDKQMYDECPEIKQIVCKTSQGTYIIQGEIFDTMKTEIDYGYGKQYAVPLEFWDVS